MPTDAVIDLVRVVIENMSGAGSDWDSLAMSIVVRNGRVAGTSGYVYAADGASVPVASRPSGVQPVLTEYLETRYGSDDAPPVALLLQFDRVSGQYEVTFEDADSARWKVTPANLEGFAARLRPDFGGSQ